MGCSRVAGVDEAGRGPLAGPVVVAAVWFPPDWIRGGLPPALAGVHDSKKLSPRRRESLDAALRSDASVRWAISVVEVEEIDRLNILNATHLGMRRALDHLEPAPDHVLVDGLEVPSLHRPQTGVVKGDAKSYSIGAASILAKVTRDRLMAAYDPQWPGYGFRIHKGYPTPAHLAALRRLGPCPIHRRSFAPVAAAATQLGLF